MNSPRRIVIALGGNAIIKDYQRGTVPEQFENARESLQDVVKLIQIGYEVIITHGNGPQVGNILIRVEEAKEEAYELPLGVCVAESQGEMGYMIAQTLKNFFICNKINKEVISIITQVVVDKDAPETFAPVKPIGPFLSEEEADKLNKRGVPCIEDSGRGYRRIVPSPIPNQIVELSTIKQLIESGVLVIAAGGGGMPVYIDDRDCLEGIDAVVDKDLASSLLAAEIGADDLVILTTTQYVYLNFGKPDQKPLKKITLKEAKEHLAAGQFPPGSMGPKMEAALKFLESGGKTVVITSAEQLAAACRYETGTIITRS